jgi:chromate reductase
MSKIAVIVGSIRRESINRQLAQALAKLAKPKAEYTFLRIDDLPLFSQDLEPSPPDAVIRLKREIDAADGVLIVTPEYNRSIPGVLKNAIDWASRPPDQPFEKKPIAIMGASPGPLGSARAQYHLRQCFVFLNAYVMNRPEVMIAEAHKKFDSEGRLTDERTREHIVKLLVALRDWVGLLRR